jgi:hypothetical protein
MTLKFAGHCQLHSRDAFRRNWNIISPLIKDMKILGHKVRHDMLSHIQK